MPKEQLGYACPARDNHSLAGLSPRFQVSTVSQNPFFVIGPSVTEATTFPNSLRHYLHRLREDCEAGPGIAVTFLRRLSLPVSPRAAACNPFGLRSVTEYHCF